MKFSKLLFGVTLLCFFNNLSSQTFVRKDSISIQKLTNPNAIWADFNSDYFFDLLVYGKNPASDSTVFFLFENREGAEFVMKKLPFFDLSIRSVQIIDFDKDGLADIAFSGIQNSGDTLLSMLMNTGDLNFDMANDPINSILTTQFLIKDFNQDNLNEVVYISDLGELKLLEGTPDGTLLNNGIFQNVKAQHFFDLDFDNDGFQDLMISDASRVDSLSRVLVNKDDFNFVINSEVLPFDSIAIQRFSFGSFSEDALADFFISGSNKTGDPFNFLVTNQFDRPNELKEVLPDLIIKDGFLADFDSDGTTDLWLNAVDGTSSNYYWINDIANVKDTIVIASDSAVVTRFADFTFDGNLDFVEIKTDGNSLTIFFQQNELETVNKAPQSPNVYSAVQTGANLALIKWAFGSDSLTAKQALSYDLALLNASDTSQLNQPNVWTGNFTPLTPFHGTQLYAQEQEFKKLKTGDYFYLIDAADNAFNYVSVGVGQPILPRFAICEAVDLQTSTIEICENSIYIAGQVGVERNWYSDIYGPLGTSDTLVYQATVDDTLYGTVTTFQNCNFGQLIIDVKVVDGEIPPVNLPESTLICPDESVSFSVDAAWVSVSWSSQLLGNLGTAQSITYTPPATDRITLFAENTQGCLYLFSGIVEVDDFNPALEDTLHLIKVGESVQLVASGGTQYLWEPSNGLSNPRVSNPIASPRTDTKYTVTVTSDNGCTELLEVEVKVEQIGSVANLFSPNSDGVNDRIFVFLSEIPKDFRFSIYNRSGNLIYETKDPIVASQNGWNGTTKGADNPTGVYFWSVSGVFQNGQKVLLNGNQEGKISLVR
jgi:gliding motility-associated-like protein